MQGQLDIQAELLKKKKRAANWDRVQWVFVGAAASAAIVAAVVAAAAARSPASVDGLPADVPRPTSHVR